MAREEHRHDHTQRLVYEIALVPNVEELKQRIINAAVIGEKRVEKKN